MLGIPWKIVVNFVEDISVDCVIALFKGGIA